MAHTKGICAHGFVQLFTIYTARPQEQGGCAAAGRKIMAVFTGVRDGDPSVLPALLLTLSHLLDSGAERETCQFKAFKLTVCKLVKRIQIYQRKGQLEGLKPFMNPSWHILEPFLTRTKKQIQLCSPHASPMTLRNFCNATMHLKRKKIKRKEGISLRINKQNILNKGVACLVAQLE